MRHDNDPPRRAVTDAGRLILRKVIVRIGEVSPPGLGHWSPAWDLVHEPGDAFLDALKLWEQEDSPGTRQALQRAAEAFVGAWRDAARRWELEECPRMAEEVST